MPKPFLSCAACLKKPKTRKETEMSWYTIVQRITLEPDELHYIMLELLQKHPDDEKFAEAAKEIEERLNQEAHDVVLD